MESYHSHKDHDYWPTAKWDADFDKPAKTESAAQPTPTKPAKTSKPRVRNFTMIENGERIYCSMLVTEPVRIDGYQV